MTTLLNRYISLALSLPVDRVAQLAGYGALAEYAFSESIGGKLVGVDQKIRELMYTGALYSQLITAGIGAVHLLGAGKPGCAAWVSFLALPFLLKAIHLKSAPNGPDERNAQSCYTFLCTVAKVTNALSTLVSLNNQRPKLNLRDAGRVCLGVIVGIDCINTLTNPREYFK